MRFFPHEHASDRFWGLLLSTADFDKEFVAACDDWSARYIGVPQQ
ncbi:MAG: hypothetical protein V3V01_03885 [Acidimicrobiales bacterium]